VRGVVILLTFGTGIGSALFVDGELVPNTEFGHLEFHGQDAERTAAARVRTEERLDWPGWCARVNDYLARMHTLFWPDMFIIGGSISEDFDQFGHLLVSPAPIRRAAHGAQSGVVGAAFAAAPPTAALAGPMIVRSKLPRVGTTIFTVMSQRAAELGAVNLGQGFPDYDIDPRLGELVYEAMRQGITSTRRCPACRSCARRSRTSSKRSYAVQVDPDLEITVTLGATEAIFSSVQALVAAGDEVIVFDPAYDSYDPRDSSWRAACACMCRCSRRTSATTGTGYGRRSAPRTRMVIINSPHNPGCSCISAQDLAVLAELLRGRDITLISDEVYEHIVFDGRSAPQRAGARRNCASAASRCSRSARRCRRPACASATRSRRRR
jgi:hypothetical protein